MMSGFNANSGNALGQLGWQKGSWRQELASSSASPPRRGPPTRFGSPVPDNPICSAMRIQDFDMRVDGLPTPSDSGPQLSWRNGVLQVVSTTTLTDNAFLTAEERLASFVKATRPLGLGSTSRSCPRPVRMMP